MEVCHRAGKSVEIQWPIPLKLDEPGDIQIYGYHDEVLLLQEITPPASICGFTNVNLPPKRAGLFAKRSAFRAARNCNSICPWLQESAPANEELFLALSALASADLAPDAKVASLQLEAESG